MRPKGPVYLAEDGLAVRKILIAGLVTGLLAAPATSGEIAEAASPAAISFAGQFSDDHLSGMLSRIGARTETMMMLGQLNGRLTEQVFNAEIDAAVARHGDAWRLNMARAWTSLMSDEELASLVADGAASPHADKYLAQRNTAGDTMQALSQDLFAEILREVLGNTLTTVRTIADEG